MIFIQNKATCTFALSIINKDFFFNVYDSMWSLFIANSWNAVKTSEKRSEKLTENWNEIWKLSVLKELWAAYTSNTSFKSEALWARLSAALISGAGGLPFLTEKVTWQVLNEFKLIKLCLWPFWPEVGILMFGRRANWGEGEKLLLYGVKPPTY